MEEFCRTEIQARFLILLSRPPSDDGYRDATRVTQRTEGLAQFQTRKSQQTKVQQDAIRLGDARDRYFDRERKGMTGGDCMRSSASQMGHDHTSFKVPCSGKGSACSTRLCVVHLAVGKPLRPMPWSSSIIFWRATQLRGLSLYPKIAIARRTLSKRKLEGSFFRVGEADPAKGPFGAPTRETLCSVESIVCRRCGSGDCGQTLRYLAPAYPWRYSSPTPRKHRIVHLLQKQVLNPPIKVFFCAGHCPAGIRALGNHWSQDRKASSHSGR